MGKGRATCPKCGSEEAKEILYGLYEDIPPEVLKGNAVLGGCVVDEGNPAHICKKCGKRFGSWGRRSFSADRKR